MEMIQSLTLEEAKQRGWDVETIPTPEPFTYTNRWETYEGSNVSPTRLTDSVQGVALNGQGGGFDGVEGGFNVAGFEGGCVLKPLPASAYFISMAQLMSFVGSVFVLGKVLEHTSNGLMLYVRDYLTWQSSSNEIYAMPPTPSQKVKNTNGVMWWTRPPVVTSGQLVFNGTGSGSRLLKFVFWDIRFVQEQVNEATAAVIIEDMLRRYEEKMGKPYE